MAGYTGLAVSDSPSTSSPTDEPVTAEPLQAKKRFRLGAILGVLSLLGVALFLLLGTGASDAFVYSKLVNEVVANPAAFAGKKLRVEGELKPGSIQFREEPCEWKFVLSKSDTDMAVRFPECVVPDTFRDGMGISVTVQGNIQTDGTFLASDVVPRCPSKYEMQQRKQNGEAAPHAMTQAAQ